MDAAAPDRSAAAPALPDPSPAPQAQGAIALQPPAPPAAPPSFSSAGTVAAGLLLAALAAAALVLARRRRGPARLLEVVESASLGPKRALVVARFGDELLVLGASEGGVSLLATRPAPPREAPHASFEAAAARPPGDDRLPALAVASDALPSLASALARGLARAASRLMRKSPGPRPAEAADPTSFDAALAESLEDAELRRKLAAGRAGSVR